MERWDLAHLILDLDTRERWVLYVLIYSSIRHANSF
jgi:hypothetical protein